MGASEPALRLGALLIAASALTACRREPAPAPAPKPQAKLQVAFAGCGEVLAGPICELSETSTLTLWTSADPAATLTLELDGRAQAVNWRVVDDGRQVKIAVPVTARRLTVHASPAGPAPEARFELPMRLWERPAALVQALRLRSEAPTEALALLDAIDSEGDLRLESEVLSVRGKVQFSRGKLDEVIVLRNRAARLAADQGLLDKPFSDLAAVAHVTIYSGRDAARARATLDAMAALPRTEYGEVLLRFYEGFWARLTGDPRTAARTYAEAERGARRLGLGWFEETAAQQRADLLTTAGLHAAAFAVLDGVAPTAGGCQEALWRHNRAWAGLMALEVGASVPFNPTREVERALALLPDCGEALERSNLLSTLALASLRAGDLGAAERAIEEAWTDRATLLPDAIHWLRLAEARLALHRGHLGRARAAFERLDRFSARSGQLTGRWRAAVGRARVFEATGSRAAAERAYTEAEALLDEERSSELFPSRLAALPHARARAARRFAALRMGHDPRGAVEILERHVSRRMRGLARASRVAALPPERRSRWDEAAVRYADLRDELDALEAQRWGQSPSSAARTRTRRHEKEALIRAAFDDALAALGPEPPVRRALPPMPEGELRLGYHRLDEGWLGYALSREGFTAERLRLPSSTSTVTPSLWAQALLTPFEHQIASSRRISVAAHDALAKVDFHALPFEGAPLLAQRIVVYTVGAPALPPRTPSSGVLVISDPDGSLPGARDEGEVVARRVASRGQPVSRLAGRAATRRGLLEAPPVDLWHWAGHARSVEGGLANLGGTILPLAAGASLTVGDVLALRNSPHRVVLAGCETAPPDATHLDMARAFLLVGAEVVIATSRKVRDTEARGLAEALYAEGAPDDLAAALRRAQLALRSGGGDWPAFRALVP